MADEEIAEVLPPPEWKLAKGHYKNTLKRLAKVLIKLAEHGYIEPACAQSKLAKRTFYDFCQAHPDYKKEVDAAIGEGDRKLEDTGYACANMAATDPRYNNVLILALKTKLGWVEHNRLTLEGGENPIQHKLDIDLSNLTTEQLRAIIAGGDDADREEKSDSNGGGNGNGAKKST